MNPSSLSAFTRAMVRLLILILLAGCVAASEPRDDEARVALAAAAAATTIDRAVAAADAKEVAWAAWSAEGHRSAEVEAALIRALAARGTIVDASPKAIERRCAIDRILDLLIRWRAKLPPDVLAELVDDRWCADAAIILACAHPDAGAPALRRLLAGRPSDMGWAAACDVLVASKDTSLAATLLRPLTIRLSLAVTDPGMSGGGARFGSRSSGDGHITVLSGFPPDVIWWLTLLPRVGDQVIADGPVTVHARRREFPVGTTGFGGGSGSVERDVLTPTYLALLMTGLEESPRPLKTRVAATVVWSDAAAFVAEAAAAHARCEAAWREVADALVAARMLDPAERATLAPQIDVRVRDDRADKSVPLPPVAGQTTPVEY